MQLDLMKIKMCVFVNTLWMFLYVAACILEEAEKVCSESVAPFLSSILEALSENIGSGILGMQETLHTQMDSNFSLTNGGTEETKQVRCLKHFYFLASSYEFCI